MVDSYDDLFETLVLMPTGRNKEHTGSNVMQWELVFAWVGASDEVVTRTDGENVIVYEGFARPRPCGKMTKLIYLKTNYYKATYLYKNWISFTC